MAARSHKGVHYCMVKGVTHRNSDGTSRSDVMKDCSIGEPVKLVPEPENVHDRNAIRVIRIHGQQLGYISARQARRFAGRVHLLTATVHSRVKDEWGNDTLNLLVVDSEQQQPFEASSSTHEWEAPATAIPGTHQPAGGKPTTTHARGRDLVVCVLMGFLAALVLYQHWWLTGIAATCGFAYSVWSLRG